MSETAQRASEARLELAEQRREERRQRKAEEARKRPARRERRRRMPVNAEQADARDEWLRMPWLQSCEVCKINPATERHHAIREQSLKTWARARGVDFEVARFDIRNRIWICASCHSAHTQAVRRIPYAVLRAETIEFARELGLEWLLDQEYSVEEAA